MIERRSGLGKDTGYALGFVRLDVTGEADVLDRAILLTRELAMKDGGQPQLGLPNRCRALWN